MFTHPIVSFEALTRGFPWNLGHESCYQNRPTRVPGLPGDENCVIICFESIPACDGRTDGHSSSARQNYRAKDRSRSSDVSSNVCNGLVCPARPADESMSRCCHWADVETTGQKTELGETLYVRCRHKNSEKEAVPSSNPTLDGSARESGPD